MRVLIAAGGSGGHIFPAIALARTLEEKSPRPEIRFVGSDKILDRRIFEREGFRYSLLSANRFPYRITAGIVPFLLKLISDTAKSFRIITTYRPTVVVGFGGYVSIPVIFVARLLGIPKLVHEQNVVPGRANSLLFRLADAVAISFRETAKYLGRYSTKAFFTGNPIRAKLFSRAGARDEGLSRLGLDHDRFTILVIGGSQGAHFLNETFVKALSGLDGANKEALQVVHITGIKDYEWVLREYEANGVKHRVHSFLDRIEEAYAASDLVVTRSGASALFEIAFFGRPMMLIPYPFAMSHQAENARVFAEAGAAIAVDEASLSADLFKENILTLMKDKNRLVAMSESAGRMKMPRAAEDMAERVLSLAGKK
jgi:UDP-N-acetylglucosamine--N-acetylmuramyl-(pentapeptide) pyrophosphoryl-undecaprenol N-acetylglucosamine transferase